MSGQRILRREEVGKLRSSDRILRDAHEMHRDSRQKAVLLEQEIVSDARKRALQEAAQAASKVLADAERTAQKRMQELEPHLARLVANTVRSILGNFEPEEASYLAAVNALRHMREHCAGRIFVSEEMQCPIKKAVETVDCDGPEVLSVTVDYDAPKGRAHLVSDRGSAEIGLDTLIRQALAPWEDTSSETEPGDADG